jgi:glycosyltransferase involved in cell wall biosynthesis
MPVHNTRRFVEAAIKSVLSQTFADLELIIVDDGSNDGSTLILVNLAKIEKRIRLITRHNLGLIATRNELLHAAVGEFIAWMDSDDISLPTRLCLQLKAFEEDPLLSCVGTAVQCIDTAGNYLNIERYSLEHAEITLDQYKGGALRFATTMMRRSVAQGVGGFREPLRIGEDFDFLLRLGEIGKLGNLPDVLYLYRQHVASVCATMGPQWTVYRDYILSLAKERATEGTDRLHVGVLPNVASPTVAARAVFQSQIYLSWAHYSLLNKNRLLGIKYALLAILSNPLSITSWKRAVKYGLKSCFFIY